MSLTKELSNDNKSINTYRLSAKKSAVIFHLKKSSFQQKLEKSINPKAYYLELFRKIVKKYVLFFEFSVMKTAVRTMKKNKWKKFYRSIKFLSLRKIKWKILYDDIFLSNKIKIFQNEKKRLNLRKIYLSFYIKERKLKFMKDFDDYLMTKYLKIWENNKKRKEKINMLIYKYIDDCSNCYFRDVFIKSVIKIQKWFRDVQFYKKLDNIYDLENSANLDQDKTKNQFNFGSSDFIVKFQPIKSLFFFDQSAYIDVYEREIDEFSKTAMKETSSKLSLHGLFENNENQSYKNLLQYKFLDDEDNVEEKSSEFQAKKFLSRSKKNEVINSQLKPIKLKIGCSFKKLLNLNDPIQLLSNFIISPEIKSPNDILIIERTEILKEPKEPKFIIYQRRYRTPLPNYDATKNRFSRSRAVQSPKRRKSNVIKQIFYSPKKINPNKISQYNKENNERGINAEVLTLEDYLISNLNIDIPLRFSDLLTEENLNIHEFEITYDPVMKQGIDDEIETIFQYVTFVPHLSFRKFIQKNIESIYYFLKYFRYLPYHLSKHQKRKLTEIVEPILYSIMFGNISTVLSGNYTNCFVKNMPIGHKRSSANSFFHNHHYSINNFSQTYNKRSHKHKHQSQHHSHRYNSVINNNFDLDYSSDDNQEITESEISGDYISDIKLNPSSPFYDSYLNIKETDMVFFCGESQVLSDDNDFLINDYQSLKFKKKRKKPNS